MRYPGRKQYEVWLPSEVLCRDQMTEQGGRLNKLVVDLFLDLIGGGDECLVRYCTAIETLDKHNAEQRQNNGGFPVLRPLGRGGGVVMHFFFCRRWRW